MSLNKYQLKMLQICKKLMHGHLNTTKLESNKKKSK